MARIRSVKPEFFRHTGIGKMSRDHRILFIGLWTIADREGRLVDDPLRIKADIFPYDDDLNDTKVSAMLWDLHQHREKFIVRYMVDGVEYIHITKFSEHQRPHPRDPQSKYPPLESGEVRDENRESEQVQGNPRLSVEINSGGGVHGSQLDPCSLIQDTKIPRVQDTKKPPGSKNEKRETWMTPYADAWVEVIGGDFPAKQFAGQMSSLHKRAESEQALDDLVAAFRNYLEQHTGSESRFLKLDKFAQTWRQWIAPPGGRSGRNHAPSRNTGDEDWSGEAERVEAIAARRAGSA